MDIKPVKSGKVNVDGVNLYYELYGQGDPLVLIAGTGISLAPWPRSLHRPTAGAAVAGGRAVPHLAADQGGEFGEARNVDDHPPASIARRIASMSCDTNSTVKPT